MGAEAQRDAPIGERDDFLAGRRTRAPVQLVRQHVLRAGDARRWARGRGGDNYFLLIGACHFLAIGARRHRASTGAHLLA